jgi:hypothetical protein
MKSKFAEVVMEAQAELLEQQGATQIDPAEAEGMMRWMAQGDPNSFKQFDGQKGEQYVSAMVNAYRQSQQQQQQNPAQQPDANAQQQTDPNAQQQADPNAQTQATAPSTSNAPTQTM